MAGFGGQSMAGRLGRVLVASPRAAGWLDRRAQDWKSLGFLDPPQPDVALAQHGVLEKVLADSGSEVVSLPAHPALTLDALYAHDSSFMTDHGAILLRRSKLRHCRLLL